MLWHGNDTELQQFISILESDGANILKGGRFYHISDHCNKGLAMQWLKATYEAIYQKSYLTLALGDNHNDIAMLNAADFSAIYKYTSTSAIIIIQTKRHIF